MLLQNTSLPQGDSQRGLLVFASDKRLCGECMSLEGLPAKACTRQQQALDEILPHEFSQLRRNEADTH
jgi:hypothetical protein